MYMFQASTGQHNFVFVEPLHCFIKYNDFSGFASPDVISVFSSELWKDLYELL